MSVNIAIPSLGDKFKDYRVEIPGDSYSMGPLLNAGQIKYFAFHHSVTPQTAKTDGDWKKECNVIANLHIPLYGGVGYRFIIASNGVVAYVGDLSHGGAAVANHNNEIISACMIGDFTKYLPTDAQIRSAHLLAKHFLEKEPAYPQLDVWADVIGHKDASKIWNEPQFATACPGTSWPNDMKWRIETGTVYTPGPTPVPVPPTPPPSDQCKVEKDRIKELEVAIEKLKIDSRTELAAYKTKVSELVDKVKQL